MSNDKTRTQSEQVEALRQRLYCDELRALNVPAITELVNDKSEVIALRVYCDVRTHEVRFIKVYEQSADTKRAARRAATRLAREHKHDTALCVEARAKQSTTLTNALAASRVNAKRLELYAERDFYDAASDNVCAQVNDVYAQAQKSLTTHVMTRSERRADYARRHNM
jgi:hypothetical protein